jgi:hypothetical protein
MSRHKYGAVATVVDGIRFMSKAEAARWSDLKLLEKAGEIRDLERQPRFPLFARGSAHAYDVKHVGDYVADFRYRAGKAGILTIEEVKGVMTPLARWKIRHFELQYGHTVTLIRRGRVVSASKGTRKGSRGSRG